MNSHGIDFHILTANTSTEAFSAGQVIFNAGDEARQLYLVKSGEVEIRLGDRVLETVGPDGVFGEMALIDHSFRSASAVGKTAGELVPLSEKQFIFLVGETPYFALNLMRVMARRLRATTAATS
ncbi:MAG: cyclic nucleotide-binding protein [Devosia sp.]|uniref:Crp/Fnr family transcriptional regulator n=1 Tax=Devosia sp. TaxID=1871048 RepID=UPI0026334197|nr:Crp/Fnr family transcriptional regulator [Devosia sp.]MDB5541369.1 cyclic nucleotide-binding protein [Devosia sp.]